MIWSELASTMIGRGDCLIEWNMNLQESLVQSVQDFWAVSISYQYEGRDLVQMDWSDGRRLTSSTIVEIELFR